MTVSFSELRAKEVIRLCDAECIGCVSDILFDCRGGCICALCVTSVSGLGAVFCGERTVIPWEKIRCIGRETILADISAEDCHCSRAGSRQGWKKRFSHRSE